jgi:hypothetical protein
VEPDGTPHRPGWAGVWTRDISYSIISRRRSAAGSSQTSLLRKVTRAGRIVSGHGPGGAYPCSTDRIIGHAAWEIYKATGDESWLRQVYPIIKQSIEPTTSRCL